MSFRLLCSAGTLSIVTLDRDSAKSRPLMCSLSRYEEGRGWTARLRS
jgi:hypothetical protein